MAIRKVLTVCLLHAVLFSLGYCQNCASQITCGNCISNAGCFWCSEETFSGTRCEPIRNITDTACDINSIENPTSSFDSEISTDMPSEDPINITRVGLNLRVGDPQTFFVNVTPRANLPLDLYILIDLSSSMNAELSVIKSVANRIADQINTITRNVRLGFGSFNDKPLSPYTRTPIDLTCDEEDMLAQSPPYCPTYAFRHSANLTSDSTAFAQQVSGVNLTANADRPENGLEGLAQVITCESIIGWRARENGIGTRLVLFMTDEEFHFAGEGRYGGILKPYNGECLLTPNPAGGPVDFTRFGEFDYPSVGQIRNLLREFGVTTIFAIQDDHQQSYRNLVNFINMDGAAFAVVSPYNVMNSDQQTQDRILQLIEDEYREILQGVSLDTGNLGDDVEVTVVPTCPPRSNQVMDGCDNVEIDSSVTFAVTVTLTRCNPMENGTVVRQDVTSPSFGSFVLEYTIICNCDCAVTSTERSAGECSGMGIRSCGVCECDPGKCGSQCSQTIGNRATLDCPRGGVENETCSGRGTCDCICICDPGPVPGQIISGDACQCDNFRCDLDANGRVCSGRGMCCGGSCICANSTRGYQYRGDNCECEPEEEACIDPNGDDARLCNGRGICECNFCRCTDSSFSGRYCEIPGGRECGNTEDENCINQCREAFPDNSNLPDRCEVCNVNRPLLFINAAQISDFSTTFDRNNFLEMITNLRLGHSTDDADAAFMYNNECEFPSGQCITDYYILSNETHQAIVAVRELMCIEVASSGFELPIPQWLLAVIVVASLLLIGILIVVLIRVLLFILDYMDFKKWQKEAGNADFSKNQNPLYQSPEMKYENVMYGKE